MPAPTSGIPAPLAALVALLALGGTARADTYEIVFSGIHTNDGQAPLDTLVTSGETFDGNVRFNSNVADRQADPDIGIYRSLESAFLNAGDGSVTIGFTPVPPSIGEMSTQLEPNEHRFRALTLRTHTGTSVGPFVPFQILVTFHDTTQTVLPDDGLPLTFDFGDWNGADLAVFYTSDGGTTLASFGGIVQAATMARLASTVCGDGIDGSEEECDDANTMDGDGCAADCTLELCGDGVVDRGELCDDGNTVDGDGCPGDCIMVPEPSRPLLMATGALALLGAGWARAQSPRRARQPARRPARSVRTSP